MSAFQLCQVPSSQAQPNKPCSPSRLTKRPLPQAFLQSFSLTPTQLSTGPQHMGSRPQILLGPTRCP